MELSKNIFFNTDKLVENSKVKISYLGELYQENSDEVTIHYGFGLKQMQERVAIINGEVIYDGHDGFLTEVKIPIGRGERYD